MAFIGNTNTTQAFAPAIDYFNGNGSTTAFTLSRPVASVAQVQVVINNVPQNPSDAYTVSGNTITFTSAPSSGTSNIYVYYTSPVTQVVQPSTGTVGKTQLDVYGGTGTGAMTVPTGTTAQRPSVPLVGDTRWNTTLGALEVYVGSSTWQSVASPTYSVDYLAIAGGGGGGCYGGGGGGGGFVTGAAVSVVIGTAYTVTVGAGGTGATSARVARGVSGNSSVINGIATVIGGGGGGTGGVDTPAGSGASGGSGGGGSAGDASSVGGAGTSGQGYAGGSGINSTGGGGGGGGGAGAVGGNASGAGTIAGNGGAGLSSSYSGSVVFYAGGGGGGAYQPNSTAGSGGNGGGAAGSTATGSSATANTGGGGGGGGYTSGYYGGGNGGSGLVIIRYAGTSARATGGTITITGGYVIHTFTTSGTFTA